MLSLHVYETISLCKSWTLISQCRNSISRYFLSQKQKCRFILFQYTNVFLCAKLGGLKPRINEKRRPQIWTCFWAKRGDQLSKIEKISISRAIRLEFLRSLDSAIRYEAHKITRLREERPIGSRAIKMLRDLRLRARSRASCGGGKRARQSESMHA